MKTKQKYIGICIVAASILPLLVGVQNAPDRNTIISNISSISGFVGMALLVVSLVIGTSLYAKVLKLSVINKEYFSKLLLKLGSAFVLVHPLIIGLTHSKGIAYLYSFSFASTFDTYVSIGRLSIGILLLGVVVAFSLRVASNKVNSKVLPMTGYTALIISLVHVPQIGDSLLRPLVYAFWTVLVLLTVSSLLFRTTEKFYRLRFHHKDFSGRDAVAVRTHAK